MSEIKALTMPRWGFSMEEGSLNEWLIEEGGTFNEGDALAEIESSKIADTMIARFSGTLRRKVAQNNQVLPVGALLAVVAEPDISESKVEMFVANYQVDADIPVDSENSNNNSATDASIEKYQSPFSEEKDLNEKDFNYAEADTTVNATSHARRLAKKLGLSLSQCKGTGSNGRISVSDVEAFYDSFKESRSTIHVSELTDISQGSLVETIPLNTMRRNVANHLQKAKQQAPHFRLIIDCEIDSLLSYRNTINNNKRGAKVTINDFLIKACGEALIQVPQCNVQFDGTSISRYKDADIAIAVALKNGLVTPVIKTVNRKTLQQIASETSELIKRAMSQELKLNDIEGGTFTISNLGMYGIKQFDAIINVPQSIILAVGQGEQRVLVKDGELCISTVMTISLSCDHRVIDGVVGAEFLNEVKRQIENPELFEDRV